MAGNEVMGTGKSQVMSGVEFYARKNGTIFELETIMKSFGSSLAV